MENASKALLIAGAILIAILLIAIGMMVFNSASGVIDTAASGMSDYEKTMHNKKFTIYEGKQMGSNVKNLIEIVRQNNENDDNPKIKALCYYSSAGATKTDAGGKSETGPTATQINNVEKAITNSGTYVVTCKDNINGTGTGSGVICRIEIVKNN